MKQSNSIPPIYQRCKDAFGIDWDKGVIITYGDTIYCKFPLPYDLLEHEKVHIRQQEETGADEWWERYFLEPDFRLSQELEAYRRQVIALKEYMFDKNKRFKVYNFIWKSMADMYGGMCTLEEAKKLIPWDSKKS